MRKLQDIEAGCDVFCEEDVDGRVKRDTTGTVDDVGDLGGQLLLGYCIESTSGLHEVACDDSDIVVPAT